jgi:predicted nucleic acid-binding protein
MVVDASVAVEWVVPEAGSDEAVALLGKELCAPSLWLAEAANALRKKCRRGELTDEQARMRAQDLADAPLETVELPILLPAAMRMAADLGHSIYDCFYLTAALVRDTTLVTADHRFAAKASGHPHLAGRIEIRGAPLSPAIRRPRQ